MPMEDQHLLDGKSIEYYLDNKKDIIEGSFISYVNNVLYLIF